jgi:CIC family chloride channel protein
MAAILGGTMRAPLTSILFAFELTHDANIFLPLMIGSAVAYAFTVLTMKRSILTEKVARRGFHLSREYAVDPLEVLLVREVMRANVLVLPDVMTLEETQGSLSKNEDQRLLPVANSEGQLVGVFTRSDIAQLVAKSGPAASRIVLANLVRNNTVAASPDEPLRAVVYRMAEKGFTCLPVVERATQKFLGLIALQDLLKARERDLNEERRRERHLPVPFLFPLVKPPVGQ